MSTSLNENSPSCETTSLEAELQKSSLETQSAVINKEKAEKFKEKGNEAFKKHDFQKSIDLYTKAIEYDPTNHVYYGNRSFAYVKIELYGGALSDAKKAIELKPSYIKGYYRRATSNLALGKYKLALKDYEYVFKINPNDKDAKTKYNECQKICNMKAFEKAIAIDESLLKQSAFDKIDIEALRSSRVENDYKGPSLTENKIDLDFIKDLTEHLRNQKILHKKFAFEILFQIKDYFKKQPSLVEVNIGKDDKFTVCGDIHGQFYDLLNIFKLNGDPSTTNPYLFNGDYVDRGSFSVEVIFLMFSYKLLYPNHFFMARGNHESINMNQMYGFEGEVKSKYSIQMFNCFTEIFNNLPLCHLINEKVIVMHGGLFSKDDVTLADIKAIDRRKQPPEDGLMCDLMWSDPQYLSGRSESKRGVGIQFGPDVTKAFLKKNNLEYVIRSHEVKQEGYEVMHDGKCITVFSAPNYCDSMGNKGAFINFTGGDLTPKYVTYEAVEHPKIKPMAYAGGYQSLFF